MKKTIVILFFLTAACTLYAKAIAEEVSLADEKADTSYAFGFVLGQDLQGAGLDFNYAAFAEGFRAAVEGNAGAKFTIDEAIDRAQTALQAADAAMAEENRIKEALFLVDNAKKDTVLVTGSGLQYEVIREGSGAKPAREDLVTVHYEGSLIDGTVFDSSFERGEPVEFGLGGVIPGWTEGLQLMNVGSVYRLYIPSRLAYGEQGAGRVIPPYSTLVFEVELLAILEAEDVP
jgi:FKBP-type peptidyl-prolyl cis-trans isomerase FkpA